jgi:Flp pilus assembly protein TadG
VRAARRLGTLKDDESGLALVEFACVMPVLLLMYLGGYQLTDALSCNRKVTITARAIADLTTQNATVTTSTVNTFLSAATQILAPYKASNAVVRVTEFQTDANGNTTVAWSKDNQGGLTAGSQYTLPPNIKINKSCIILSEVTYAYRPAVSFRIVGPLTLTDHIYMNPRVSPSVDLDGTANTICVISS